MDRILAHLGPPVTAKDFVEIRGPPDELGPADEVADVANDDDGIDGPFFADGP